MSSPDAGAPRPGPFTGGSPARYEVLEVLGRGATGVVYKARDRELDRVVALKTLRTEARSASDEERRRLVREATAAARLSHPGIVAIYDVVLASDVPHVVMEYVRGESLARVLRAGPLPVEQATRLAIQLCRALEYAHGEGVVHGDITPSNILLASDGTAKLTDFGVARVAGAPAPSGVAGTPAYMAPEQLDGRPPDARSDLFSVAVVLYEALTGRRPFPGDDVATVLYEIAHGEPVPARELNDAIPPALDAVLRRALARDPNDRYPDARALAEALEQALDGPGRGWRWPEGPVALAAGAALFAAGAGLVAALGIGGAERVGPAPGAEARGKSARPTPVGMAVAERRGAIEIATDPGVEVLVDGVPSGRAVHGKLTVENLPPGRREVTLRLGDREQVLRERVEAGERANLRYRFAADTPRTPARRPAPPATPSTAVSAPSTASAPPAAPRREGPARSSRRGDAPRKAASPRDEAAARTEPRRPDPAPRREVPAPADAAPRPPVPVVAAAVTPAAEERRAPASFGCVSVNAVPFATVFIDGVAAGETPRACLRVPTGARLIRFESEDGRSPDRLIVVTTDHTPDQPLRVSYDFHARRFIDP